MNSETPIGAQERGFLRRRHALDLQSPISRHHHGITGLGQDRGGGGGIDGGGRRHHRNTGAGVVRPRSRHDLRDSDVAAVPPRLDAQLPHEVRWEPQNPGGQAAIGSRRRAEPSRLDSPEGTARTRVLVARVAGEVGI